MKYLAFVGTEGAQPEDALEYMRREWPAYQEELDRRGGWRLGRELNHPPAQVTVRVRDGRTLVTDGPFAETKEFVAGFDLFEAADLAEAIEVESRSPVVRFCPFEIRSFGDLVLAPGVSAFAEGDDSSGIPYLLTVWAQADLASRLADQAVSAECDAWRQDLKGRGVFVLGGALAEPETATTLRLREGELRTNDGPFLDVDGFIAGIDVIRASDRQQAVDLAATHPLARYHAIEIEKFHTE
jgi:hypothetical protein